MGDGRGKKYVTNRTIPLNLDELDVEDLCNYKKIPPTELFLRNTISESYVYLRISEIHEMDPNLLMAAKKVEVFGLYIEKTNGQFLFNKELSKSVGLTFIDSNIPATNSQVSVSGYLHFTDNVPTISVYFWKKLSEGLFKYLDDMLYNMRIEVQHNNFLFRKLRLERGEDISTSNQITYDKEGYYHDEVSSLHDSIFPTENIESLDKALENYQESSENPNISTSNEEDPSLHDDENVSTENIEPSDNLNHFVKALIENCEESSENPNNSIDSCEALHATLETEEIVQEFKKIKISSSSCEENENNDDETCINDTSVDLFDDC